MPATIVGLTQLNSRLNAISSPESREAFMGRFAFRVQGIMQVNTPRKTGSTGRSIHPEEITPVSAKIVGSPVLIWIDEGTGLYGPLHHRIVPVNARALSWTGGSFGSGGSLRLTGKPRKGAAGAGAGRITVRSTAGMHARPFIERSAREAAARSGIAVDIGKAWDAGA